MADAKPRTRRTPAKAAPAAPQLPQDDAAVASLPPVVPPMAVAARAEVVKMKDFLARVTEALGAKKKSPREVVEATLATLGAAVVAGESFNLPSLGRGRVVKSAAGVTTLKLRQAGAEKSAAKADKQPLAASDD